MPPGVAIGPATNMNSHRFSFAAVSASALKSALSMMFIPSATSTYLWSGSVVFLVPAGMLLVTACTVNLTWCYCERSALAQGGA